MPLSKGTTNASREENVKREIAAGKNPKQAVAIAYSQQNKNKENKSKDNKADVVQPLLKDVIADLQLLVKLINQ